MRYIAMSTMMPRITCRGVSPGTGCNLKGSIRVPDRRGRRDPSVLFLNSDKLDPNTAAGTRTPDIRARLHFASGHPPLPIFGSAGISFRALRRFELQMLDKVGLPDSKLSFPQRRDIALAAHPRTRKKKPTMAAGNPMALHPSVADPITIKLAQIQETASCGRRNGTYYGKGVISDDLIAYHEARARSGVGLTTLEVTTTFIPSSVNKHAVRLGTTASFPASEDLSAAVQPRHELFTQLWHGGQRGPRRTAARPGQRHQLPSRGALLPCDDRDRDRRIVAAFAAAKPCTIRETRGAISTVLRPLPLRSRLSGAPVLLSHGETAATTNMAAVSTTTHAF